MFLEYLRRKRMDWIVQRFDSDDLTDRHNAIEALAKFGTRVVPRLVNLLTEGPWRRRNAAAICLERLNWAPQTETERLPYLIARWDSNRRRDQLVSVAPAATAHLIPLLRDPSPSVRQKALSFLQITPTQPVFDGILGALDQGLLSGESVLRLFRDDLKDAEAVERIMPVLLRQRLLPPGELEQLSYWLGERFNLKFLPLLCSALTDKDASFRLFAARALHRLEWVPQTISERLQLTLAARDWSSFVNILRESPTACLLEITSLLSSVEDNRESADYERKTDTQSSSPYYAVARSIESASLTGGTFQMISVGISPNSAGDFAGLRPPISLIAAGVRSEATLEFFCHSLRLV